MGRMISVTRELAHAVKAAARLHDDKVSHTVYVISV
jgi:hypothetical protein